MGDSEANGEDGPTDRQAWIDGIERLLDANIDREEQLEFTCEDLSIEVPMEWGEEPSQADWVLDGTVRIDVEGTRGPLAEWLRLCYDRLEADGTKP